MKPNLNYDDQKYSTAKFIFNHTINMMVFVQKYFSLVTNKIKIKYSLMQMQFFVRLKKHEKPAVHVFRHLRKNLTLKKEKEFKKYSRYSTFQN